MLNPLDNLYLVFGQAGKPEFSEARFQESLPSICYVIVKCHSQTGTKSIRAMSTTFAGCIEQQRMQLRSSQGMIESNQESVLAGLNSNELKPGEPLVFNLHTQFELHECLWEEQPYWELQAMRSEEVVEFIRMMRAKDDALIRAYDRDVYLRSSSRDQFGDLPAIPSFGL